MRSSLDLSSAKIPTEALAGPTRVRFASPTGQATGDAEIAVVFSRPIRALNQHDSGPSVSPTIDPPVVGRWHWVGSSALRFAPDQRLPAAHAFRVTVPTELEGPDGARLGEPYRFSFETERPELRRSSPSNGSQGIPVDFGLELEFNLPVEPGEVARRISVRSAKSNEPVAVRVEPSKLEIDSEVLVRPKDSWPAGERIVVTLSAGLASTAGPKAMEKDATIRFSTAPAGPVRVVDLRCDPDERAASRCDVTRPIHVVLSNFTDDGLVRKAVRIRPEVDFYVQPGEQDELGRQTYDLYGPFEPGQSYVVELQADGRRIGVDPVYQPLLANHRRLFRFGDRPPRFRFGGRGIYWPAQGEHLWAVFAENIYALELRAARLDEEQVLSWLAATHRGEATPAPDGVHFDSLVTLDAPKRNESLRTRVALQELLRRTPRGPVLVRASYLEPARVGAEPTPRTANQVVQVTELAISSLALHRAVHVWVTGLSTGQPVGGAWIDVRSLDEPSAIVGRARTMPNGLATVELPERFVSPPAPRGGRFREHDGRFVVVVRTPGDWAYQQVSAPPAPRPMGLVFSERGLYRPGETVHLQAMFRRPASQGLVTPVGEEVELEVTDPSERTIARFRGRLNRYGTTSQRVLIPKTAELGWYFVRARLGAGETTTRITVADYEPTSFELGASLDRSSYVRGDRITCRSTGTYLHGGPMAGAKVSVSLSRSTYGAREPNVPRGFIVTDSTQPAPTSESASTKGRLDRAGEHRFGQRLTLAKMRGPEQVTCHVSAADLDDRVHGASEYALVHPGTAYLAIKRPDQQVRVGEKLETEVLAIDLDGKRVALPVEVRLTERTLSGYGSTPVDRELARCTVRTGAANQRCRFDVPAGKYEYGRRLLVVRATSTDERGNPIGASYDLVPESPPPPPQPPPPAPTVAPRAPEVAVEAPRDFDLGLSPSSSAPGERVTVSLQSPWKRLAHAWVAAGNEELLFQRVVELAPKGTKVSLPISEAMMPNIWVAAHGLVDGQVELDGWEDRIEELEVSARSRQLEVALSTSDGQARPGDAIDLEVTVRDQRGRPVRAEVTLFGADEATLALYRYRTPDPFHAFYTDRMHSLRVSETRENLFRSFWPFGRSHRARPPRVRMGASSISNSPVRHDFRQTVLFEPGLVTDARGRVKRRVRLPEALTSYRFMAVAATAGARFGAAQAEVKTSLPLMVRAHLPRVVRAGDRFKLVGTVTTHGLRSQKVRVALRATGLAATGPSTRELVARPDVPMRVEFPVRAAAVGSYRVVLEASTQVRDEPVKDSVARDGRVVAPVSEEATTISGDTTGPVAEALGDLSAIRRDAGRLTVRLARSRLVGLADGFDQLVEYPYGCTEQTASRLVPLAALRPLARAVGAQLPADVPGAVEDAVLRLVSHQAKDGGFGLWPESRQSEPWLSTYALWALFEARRAGAQVPAPTLERAQQFLAGWLRQAAIADQGTPPEPATLDTAAFALDVLAAMGHLEPEVAERLVALEDALPLSAKALLLRGAARSGVALPADVRTRWIAELTSAVRMSGDRAHLAIGGARPSSWRSSVLATDTRATALALRALIATEPSHPLIPKLVSGLLAMRKAGSWRSTHDAAWALLALDDYRRMLPAAAEPVDARVFLGQRLIGTARLDAKKQPTASFTVPLAEVDPRDAKLTFDVSGGARLYYQARLEYARNGLPSQPIRAGMVVSRTVRKAAGLADGPVKSGLALDRLNAGQLVRVDVTVVTRTPRSYVVVDAPLAGGLAPVDPRLRTGIAEPSAATWNRRELHDDRVLFFVDELPAGLWTFSYHARARVPGEFVLPPTRAFEMYDPDVRGSTAATTLRIDR
ncbi:MAG: Ig-like domain-containing protein [Deltaproteobacteria bacterium]|nr:Ig-like domain-containing protein [Deltaproteobacteria bacterium]MBW2537416.1 Ig-like domain-containing protein [Deltaproteobacteria bacterium]